MSHGILRLSSMNRSIIFGPFSALILTCVFGFGLLHMSRSKFGATHKLIFDQFLKGKCFIRKDWKNINMLIPLTNEIIIPKGCTEKTYTIILLLSCTTVWQMSLVVHRFGHAEFKILNISFDFFKCAFLKTTTTNIQNLTGPN